MHISKRTRRIAAVSWWDMLFLNDKDFYKRVEEDLETETSRKLRSQREDEAKYRVISDLSHSMDGMEKHVRELIKKGEWEEACQTGQICTSANNPVHNQNWPEKLPDSMFLEKMTTCFRCFKDNERWKKMQQWAQEYLQRPKGS